MAEVTTRWEAERRVEAAAHETALDEMRTAHTADHKTLVADYTRAVDELEARHASAIADGEDGAAVPASPIPPQHRMRVL